MMPIPWPDRFEHQITLLLIGGMVCLVLTTSLLSSWIITQQVQKFAVTYGIKMTEQFAVHCVFAFLTEDTDVAKHSIEGIKTLPGVHAVAVLKLDYTPLVAVGDEVDWQPTNVRLDQRAAATLVHLDGDDWHFVAPVQTQPVRSPYERQVPAERLGYVHVTWDKSLLSGIQGLIAAFNLAISLVIAGLLILWGRRQVQRLVQPLNSLVSVMSRAGALSGSQARATLTGPLETREMAAVFNTLMDTIDRHQASLASEVAIRTLELREARDAALTASRHKSEFMAAVTHEMRTPLHAIQGYTQLVQNELAFLPETDDYQNWLSVVLDSASNLLMRVNQILDLARIEAGKMDVRLSSVHVPTLIARLVEMVQPLIRKHDNQLNVTCASDQRLYLDEDKVSQIMLNLLTNAAKFTEGGTIELKVQAHEETLEIVVSDTGLGIPSAQLTHIFEPFRQLDMSDTRKHAGTGLGLAITQNFCELLGGSCAVESEVGKGSCFRVVLPLRSLPLEAGANVGSLAP